MTLTFKLELHAESQVRSAGIVVTHIHTHSHNVKTITPVAVAGCNKKSISILWGLALHGRYTSMVFILYRYALICALFAILQHYIYIY